MVKAEDRDAFNALLKPYLNDLKRAAWRDLRYFIQAQAIWNMGRSRRRNLWMKPLLMPGA